MPNIPGQRANRFTPEFRQQWLNQHLNMESQLSPFLKTLYNMQDSTTKYKSYSVNRDTANNAICPTCGAKRSEANIPKNTEVIQCLECMLLFEIAQKRIF